MFLSFFFFFFFNDTATTEIYTLSLHDALPISCRWCCETPVTRTTSSSQTPTRSTFRPTCRPCASRDRKSTRLNSSHLVISYAVFCLKKKKKKKHKMISIRTSRNDNIQYKHIIT